MLGKYHNFGVLYRPGFLKKRKMFKEYANKRQYQFPVSVMLPYGFVKTGLYHRYFSRNVPTFFGIYNLFSEPPNNHCFDKAP